MRITFSQAMMALKVARMVWSMRRGNAERIKAQAERVMMDELATRQNEELRRRRDTFDQWNEEIRDQHNARLREARDAGV